MKEQHSSLPRPIRPNLHPPIIGPLLSALWRMPPIALISAAEPEEANLLPDASVKFLPYPIDRANVTKRNWKLSEVSLPRIVGMSPTRARIDQKSLVEKMTHEEQSTCFKSSSLIWSCVSVRRSDPSFWGKVRDRERDSKEKVSLLPPLPLKLPKINRGDESWQRDCPEVSFVNGVGSREHAKNVGSLLFCFALAFFSSLLIRAEEKLKHPGQSSSSVVSRGKAPFRQRGKMCFFLPSLSIKKFPESFRREHLSDRPPFFRVEEEGEKGL